MKQLILFTILVLVLMAAPLSVSADGTKLIVAKALDCQNVCQQSGKVHVIVNGVDKEANAPATISIVWTKAGEKDFIETVKMAKFTGSVAHYETTWRAGWTISKISAQIYSSWSGEFNLSCGSPTAVTISSFSARAESGWFEQLKKLFNF